MHDNDSMLKSCLVKPQKDNTKPYLTITPHFCYIGLNWEPNAYSSMLTLARSNFVLR